MFDAKPSDATSIAGSILINEIRPNPEGADGPTQQVEVRGVPGESFAGFLFSLESDFTSTIPPVGNVVDRKAQVSGTFDANGLLSVEIDDLENPSFTLVLTDDTATAEVGDTVDPANPVGLGGIFDAIGVADNATDPVVGAALGGTDIAFTGDEPKLVFRDGVTGDLFAVNDPDGGVVIDANGDEVAPTGFDIDPLSGDTFGAPNPTAGGGAGGFDLQVTEIWPGQSGGDLTEDWFEITNAGDAAWVAGVDAPLFYDDESASPDDADQIEGLTRIEAGRSVIVVIGDAADVVAFETVWGDVVDLGGVEIGFTDGAGLSQNGDAVNLFLGDPTSGGELIETEANPEQDTDGASYDVTLAAESTVGNASGAVATDALGGGGSDTPAIGSPGPALPDLTPIFEIQGAGHTSPLLGTAVVTSGIVTAVDSNGFYLQDADGDGDIATSDALFVFTGSAPGVSVSVGDEVQVEGEVSEFTPGGAATGNLSATQIALPDDVSVLSSGNALPSGQIIGAAGRVPPSENIDDDAFASFDPTTDGIDFFESLEAMLVTAQNLTAVAGTNRFGEIFGVVDDGADATGISDRGTLNISPDDFNPEKVQIDADSGILPGFSIPQVDVGDVLGDVTGVIGYSFGNFEIYPTQTFAVTFMGLTGEVTELAGDDDTLTVASYNVLNLDPNDDDGDTDVADGRFEAIAQQIVASLGSPDVVGLQEVQDNNGSDGGGVVSASQTLQLLVEAIEAAGGPAYEVIDNTFITDNASGGQPEGNIRTAFLYNPDRVDLVDGSVQTIDGQGPGEAFDGARLPLVADFIFNGETVTVVNNHLSSKGGSAPILGVEQPFEARQEDVTVNGSLDERQAQSAAIQSFLSDKLADNPDAKLVTLGDLNEFEFVSPVLGLEAVFDGDGSGGNNLTNGVAEDERYTFIFQGNSQSLDHILVSDALEDGAAFDIVHVNSEFADDPAKASDHDPLIATLTIPAAPEAFTLEILHITDQEPLNLGGTLSDITGASGIINALEAQDLGNDGLEDNTLRLSSGDAVIPGLFYAASEAVFGSAGIADIQLQNEFEFAAIALGNHEFDQGTRELSELLTGLDVTDDSDPEDDFVDTVPRSIGDFIFDVTPEDPANPTEEEQRLLDLQALFAGTDLDGETFTGADFPYLSTNLDFSTDPFLAPLEEAGGQDAASLNGVVTSSAVSDVNGELVGIVGATTPTLASISSPGDVGIAPTPFGSNPTDDEIAALAAEIQAEVDALLAANPEMNKVVLLAHMQRISIEKALAEKLENVDVIVAGGSNTRLFDENDRVRDGDTDQGEYPQFITNAGGTTTALVNTDGSYKYVGRLVIDFDADGNIVPESYDPDVSGAYATDAQGLAELDAEGLIDPEVQAIVDAIEGQIIATEGNVLGNSNVFLNGNRSGDFSPADPDGVRTQETNLGNLTADANLAAAKAADETVMVSLKNGGGIRASIGETVVPPGETEAVRLPNSEFVDGDGNVVKPEGGISQNDIATTLAFNNGLTLLTVTRAELVELLEYGVSALPDVSGRFPQVAGVQFSFDPDASSGARIQNAAITDEDGTDIDVLVRDGELVGDGAAGVRIVTLGFLAAPRFDDDGNFTGGGDGYPFPNLDDPEVAARANPVSLEEEGVRTGPATFADDGTEQDALAEYLLENFGDAANAFAAEDTAPDGDDRIQNLDFRDDTVIDAPEVNVIVGETSRDRLVGTDGDDVLITGEGRYETMEGGLGGDTFVFGEETLNGLRERDIILDYEVGIDVISLVDGATLGSIRETGNSVIVSLSDPTGFDDVVFVRGEGVTADNITIITDDPLAFA